MTGKDEKRQRKLTRVLYNIGMFLASPFIALSYIIALPLVGLYMFAKNAVEKLRQAKA